MTIGAALRTHLLSADEWPVGQTIGLQIAALVGTRIYPLRMPQKQVLPSIVLTRIVGGRDAHLRGSGSLAHPLYQVDCWAATHAAALALGKLCRLRLAGYQGTWTDDASPPTLVRVSIAFADERDLYDEDILGGTGRHSADYLLFYNTSENTV